MLKFYCKFFILITNVRLKSKRRKMQIFVVVEEGFVKPNRY